MKKKLLCTALIMCAGASHAEPKVQMTPGITGGILSTQITTTMLTDKDRARVKNTGVMMATADVYAGATNITLNRAQQGTARSTHSVCFETWLTTEADYKFTIDVGGRQIVISDHIVIPNDRRTCVQHELYENVVFNAPGAYTYYAITTGTTQMAGEKRAVGQATISVR